MVRDPWDQRGGSTPEPSQAGAASSASATDHWDRDASSTDTTGSLTSLTSLTANDTYDANHTATRTEPEPAPATERTTGSHSRVPARTGRFSLPSLTIRPLDLQVLTWWFLTRVSLLVIAVSAPSLFRPDTGAPGFLERWGNWDVAHFAKIAESGYFPEEWSTPVEAFFPGLPMIMRLGLVVGLSPVLTGMVVSLLAGGAAAVALGRLAEAEYGEGTGQKAALAWMVAPPGVFLAAPYTESLFLGFAIPAWLAARRGHWWLSGVLMFGACTVRVSGIFLLVALVVEFLTSKRRGSWENAGWLALPLVPLLAYMAYLWANTGDPMRWYNAQAEGWYREFHWPWEALLNTVRAAQGEGYGAPDAAMHANWEWMFRAELAAMLLGVVVTVVLLTMRRWSEATWIGVQLAAFSTSTWFFSVPRSMLLWFPLWIGLGALSRTRPWLWRGYIVIAAPLFGLWAAAFLLGRWAG